MGIANTARATVIRLMPIVESARFPINQSARQHLGHGKASETPEMGAEVRVRIPRNAVHLFPLMGS